MYILGTQALRDLIRSYFSSLFLTTHVHCLHNLAKGTVALPLCAQPLDCPSPSLRGQCLLPCDTSHLCSLLWVMSYHSIQAVTPWRNRPCLICVWLVTELLWYLVPGWYSVKCPRERQSETRLLTLQPWEAQLVSSEIQTCVLTANYSFLPKIV